MKLILSRKGFDSGSGGGPSPVLPDGTMVSFPIPDPAMTGTVGYADIAAGATTMADIAAALRVGAGVLGFGAHLDPDLDPAARPRKAGWRPSLGQAGAAASHLANQGVGPGDVFVFWGLYRHTVNVDGHLAWDRSRPPFHAVFAWMTVGEILRPGVDPVPGWLGEHPHVVAQQRPANTLYVSADPTPARPVPTGRLRWSSESTLTCAEGPLSRWSLPAGCHPNCSGADLSYHGDERRWDPDGDRVLLSTVGRGQEFVVEATAAWADWLSAITAGAVS